MINHDIPQVKIFPPVIPVSVLALGLLMQFLFPLPLLTSSFIKGIGFMITLASLLLLWWSNYTFEEIETPSDPTLSTQNLAIHGPYSYSRNPVYLSFMLIVFGIALWVGVLWLIFLDLAQFFALHYGVIIPEEHYLSRKFGERYNRYSSKVRRWL